VIIASRQDLQTLVKQHPRQWQAIRQWILAGGNLWVYGVGETKQQNWTQWKLQDDKPWEYIADVNDGIDFPAADETSPWKDTQPALVGWRAADPNAALTYPNQYSAGPQVYMGGQTVYVPGPQVSIVETPQVETATVQPQRTSTDPKFPFAMRPLGQGMVVAIPDGNPTNNPYFPWQVVLNNVGPERWHWSTRNGVNFSGPNENYWNFLIPGVGAAPVTAFQVLITLFVLAIGPLNFYVLRRWNKLNLLLITVPASAAAVTIALLAYAIFSDGFGVRARTRSFTALDQQTGEATCLGRITYYAGLTPSKGLSFSGDVTVYPLEEQPAGNNYDGGLTRRLAWEFPADDDRTGRQNLESGWLQSRIQTQLMTVRSRKSDAKLHFEEQGNLAISVTNQLGVPINLLLVHDAAGNYSIAHNIAADASSELSALSASDLSPDWNKVRKDNALQVPEGMEITGSHSIFGIRRRYYGRPYMGTPVTMTPETGSLERALDETLRAASLGELPTRSYIAIVERSPEFELGLDSATEESSYHIIYGRW